ncbi:hypothetical protein BB558_000863 [Smittium angustum]|uniref:ADP-ribosylation factor-like protein 2 n=1 Tax=Smittium angustum TaxID=133377 RepID=A0A2U1JD03_SMIAN|nr:hypothetical protein BB558_000863 [Smittium angustum]
MGLLTTVRKIKEKEKEMRILFLGLDNAGKTTVVKSIMKKDVNKISPTLGFTIDSFEHNGFTVNAWDVGGQRSIRPYWKNYFEKTEGIVWVVDSADRSRLHDCSEELKSVLSEQRLLGASLLILANKQDIDSAASLAEIAKGLDLESIWGHSWKIYACSAITGEGVMEGISWVVGDISGRIYMHV